MQATITSKGQITLPKALRERLHLAPGDRVEFIVEDNDVVRMVPRATSVMSSTVLKDDTARLGMVGQPPRPRARRGRRSRGPEPRVRWK